MKPKSFLLCCWLCLWPAAAAAQQPGAVYLKNGAIFRGEIVTGDPLGVTVNMSDGRSYFFTFKNIDSIKQKTTPRTPSGSSRYAELRRFDQIEFGMGYGPAFGKNGLSALSLSFISYHARITPHFSIGGKWDFDYLPDIKRWYGPLVLNVRGYFGPSTGKAQPFLSLEGGYALGFKEDEDEYSPSPHGWLITPSVGLSVRLGRNTGVLFSLGYRMQWLPEYVYTGGYSEKPILTESIMVRMNFAIYIAPY